VYPPLSLIDSDRSIVPVFVLFDQISDHDVRWNTIASSVDDRTASERAPKQQNPQVAATTTDSAASSAGDGHDGLSPEIVYINQASAVREARAAAAAAAGGGGGGGGTASRDGHDDGNGGGDDTPRIAKSRYDSISSFLGSQNSAFRPEYNDISVECNKEVRLCV